MSFSIIRVSSGECRVGIIGMLIYLPAILYKGLGIGSHSILALAAVYGTIAFLSNSVTTMYMTDQWGRRK